MTTPQDECRAALLPCPFCGGEARMGKESYKAWGGDTRQKTQVYCGNCFAMVDALEDDRDFDGKLAIRMVTEKWNRRNPAAPDESLIRELELLKFHQVEPDADEVEFISYRAGRNTALDQAIAIVKAHMEKSNG